MWIIQVQILSSWGDGYWMALGAPLPLQFICLAEVVYKDKTVEQPAVNHEKCRYNLKYNGNYTVSDKQNLFKSVVPQLLEAKAIQAVTIP